MSRFNKLGLYGINRQPWDLPYYTEDDYYTGNISFEEQIARNKKKLEELGFKEATWNDQ